MKWCGLIGTAAALLLTPAAVQAEPFTLGDAAVRMEVDEEGRITALADLATGTELVLPPADDAPAWKITLREPHAWEATARPGDRSLDSSAYPAPAVRQDDGRLLFTWEAEALPRVEGMIEFDPATSRFRTRVRVDNRSAFEIEDISFPASLAFAARPGDYLVVVADDTFTTRLRPLDLLEDFTVMYPGFMYMQLAGFKIGDSALLAYTDDDRANIKWHSFQRETDRVVHRVRQGINLRQGGSWDSPYGLVLQVLPQGGYNEMAHAYGDWARRQYWAEPKLSAKIAQRPLLENIFRYGLIRAGWPPLAWGTESYFQDEEGRYHYRENNKYAEYEPYYDELIRSFAEYEDFYGIRPGYWLPVWSGHYFDTPFPDYFPVLPEMGDFEQFKRDIVAGQYPVLYHMNIAHWPVTSASTADPSFHAGWRQGGYGRQLWSNVEHILVNLGKSIEVELPTVRRLNDAAGAGGVYLDVVGHAFVMDDSAGNPFREEPNPYQLAKVDAFRRIRETISGPIMTEGRNEIYLPYIDIAYGACGYDPADDQIPMWELVYGDCIATHPFNTQQPSFDNMTMAQGGIFELGWSWPHEDGKNLKIFTQSTRQQVLAPAIGERMRRYDREGEFRVAQWPSATFLWKLLPGGDGRIVHDGIELTGVGDGGAFLVNAANDFSAERIGEVKIGGETVYRCDVPLLFVRAGERILIFNPAEEAVTAKIYVAPAYGGGRTVAGRLVRAGQPVGLTPEGDVWTVTLPAGECLVNWN